MPVSIFLFWAYPIAFFVLFAWKGFVFINNWQIYALTALGLLQTVFSFYALRNMDNSVFSVILGCTPAVMLALVCVYNWQLPQIIPSLGVLVILLGFWVLRNGEKELVRDVRMECFAEDIEVLEGFVKQIIEEAPELKEFSEKIIAYKIDCVLGSGLKLEFKDKVLPLLGACVSSRILVKECIFFIFCVLWLRNIW